MLGLFFGGFHSLGESGQNFLNQPLPTPNITAPSPQNEMLLLTVMGTSVWAQMTWLTDGLLPCFPPSDQTPFQISGTMQNLCAL